MNGRVEDANAAIPMADIRSELSSVLLCYGTPQTLALSLRVYRHQPDRSSVGGPLCGAQLLTYLRAFSLACAAAANGQDDDLAQMVATGIGVNAVGCLYTPIVCPPCTLGSL